MASRAYELGLAARKREAWFHATLDHYRAEGLIDSLDDVLDFYRGYWSSGWDVQYEDGKIVVRNKR